jgi:hypothetical protein
MEGELSDEEIARLRASGVDVMIGHEITDEDIALSEATQNSVVETPNRGGRPIDRPLDLERLAATAGPLRAVIREAFKRKYDRMPTRQEMLRCVKRVERMRRATKTNLTEVPRAEARQTKK